MPTEQLLQQCHELRVDQFTRTLSTLPPTNAFRSRSGPSAIGKQETPVRTLDWLDAAYQSELASVRLLSDLDAHQRSDLYGLVRFSSSLDRPETAPWSTYAHGLQEERARGGLAAYLVSRIPEVAPVTPTVKALSDEFRAYAHNTSLSRLALVNNNNRIERGEESQVETLRNARGYGILQFELNGPARAMAMGNKLLRQYETESDRLRDVLGVPFARAEELRLATRRFDLHKLARSSAGPRFSNDVRSPAPAAGHAGMSI